MRTSARRADAATLEAVIRGVPGVTAIYRPAGAYSNALAAVAGALRRPADAEPLVRLESANGRLSVTAAIGAGPDSATATCRAVHDAVADWLRERHLEAAVIEITVAQVSE